MTDSSEVYDSAVRRRQVRNMNLRTSAVITERIDGGPMRPVGRRRGRRPGGLYYSAKMGRMVAWESKAERDAFFVCEVSTEVFEYREQPHTATALIDGKRRSYTPDRLDVLVDGTISIIEVKETFEAEADPDYALKLDFFGDVYRALGWRFEVSDRASLEGLVCFDAVKKVQSHRRVSFDAMELMAVRKALAGGSETVAELVRLFAHPLAGEAKLCAMMVQGHIQIDTTRPFGPGSKVARLSATE